MSTDNRDDAGRVEALENEVARLRQQLAESELEQEFSADRDDDLDVAFTADEKAVAREGSPRRAAFLTMLIVLGGLVVVGMVFTALSRGFSHFSHEAARGLVTMQEGEGALDPPKAPAVATPKTGKARPQSPPMPPGL